MPKTPTTLPALYRAETRLADMRDLAETVAELRAARKFAHECGNAAMDLGDWLAAQSFRIARDDLNRRIFAMRRGET